MTKFNSPVSDYLPNRCCLILSTNNSGMGSLIAHLQLGNENVVTGQGKMALQDIKIRYFRNNVYIGGNVSRFFLKGNFTVSEPAIMFKW